MPIVNTNDRKMGPLVLVRESMLSLDNVTKKSDDEDDVDKTANLL